MRRGEAAPACHASIATASVKHRPAARGSPDGGGSLQASGTDQDERFCLVADFAHGDHECRHQGGFNHSPIGRGGYRP